MPRPGTQDTSVVGNARHGEVVVEEGVGREGRRVGVSIVGSGDTEGDVVKLKTSGGGEKACCGLYSG